MTNLTQLLMQLRCQHDFMAQVVAWERLPSRPPIYAPFAHSMHPSMAQALHKRGVSALYAHQNMAVEAVARGENVVVSTATASGKSLCYSVPVLQTLMQRPVARALYLFPTKALAHDQLAETLALIHAGRLPVQAHSYDGDTPTAKRRQVREAGGVLISNPDMLHAGILPNHPRWRGLLQNLEFVVLDEIHAYRGVFGSHVANVLRRLQRLCRFYGSDPQFICCSATIANPKEHAERLVERPFSLIDEAQNGAPSGAKEFILYNPPLIDAELGLRSSVVLAAKDAALTFLAQDIQTIVFARARQTVELILTYLQEELAFQGYADTAVTGYRGGYLPLERREIEQGLRSGALRGVVATNALELGIDIGELDAAVITGYPGSVASTWQQAGRAGRRADQSVAIMIAGNNALDQYICHHPRYLFGGSPEHALINPDNLRIMVKHLLCSTFELPFQANENYGSYGSVDSLLNALQEEGVLHATREQYHWIGDGPPAQMVSLRTSGDDTVVIQDIGQNQPHVIGELDLDSAPRLVHEGAIYMHQAQTFLVDKLDWNGRIAQVRPVEVDYYTRASSGSVINQLLPEAERDSGSITVAHGDVEVVSQTTGYRKIKRYTHETLGFGQIDLPSMTLQTSGYWLIFAQDFTEQLQAAGILLRPNDYGPNWQTQRQRVLERDGQRCRTCGAEGLLHVHHIRPFREYNYIRGQNENYLAANKIENLVTLCPGCHRRAESGQQARSALGGLAYVLRNLAPLFLMCDPGDIEVTAEQQNPITQAPTVVVYERVAAGVGFSQRLFELHATLLSSALELVTDCRCRDGCPACVGPPGEIGPQTKSVTQELLKLLQQRPALSET
ncbi:MAG: DEAD/DEAH box helicase [Anaerolineales bacterium]|nr:DEAD/DEAH box helicase [Anaerolineales bacterium]